MASNRQKHDYESSGKKDNDFRTWEDSIDKILNEDGVPSLNAFLEKWIDEVTESTYDLYSDSANIKKWERHLGRIESMIIGLVKAIHYLDTNKEYKGDISVDFDDSIIMDEESIRKHAKEDLLLGVIDEVEYLMQVYNLTEELAQEQYNKMLKRKGIEEEPKFEGGEE